MPLPHTAIALFLSAVAAIIFTGATMRPTDMPGANDCFALRGVEAGKDGADCPLRAARASGGEGPRLVAEPGRSGRGENARKGGDGLDCQQDIRRHSIFEPGPVSHTPIGQNCVDRPVVRGGEPN